MVTSKIEIAKDLSSNSNSNSYYNLRSRPVKKTPDEGAAYGKTRKRCQQRNLSPSRKCPFDFRKAYTDQCNRCAVTALSHFNQAAAASNMGVMYELVKAGPSSGFLHRKQGSVYHCNFEAKPTNSSDDSETMLFFGELMRIYPKDPCVTNCCILGSVDDVCLGNNGCGACRSGVHHPSEGFYVGADHPRIYYK